MFWRPRVIVADLQTALQTRYARHEKGIFTPKFGMIKIELSDRITFRQTNLSSTKGIMPAYSVTVYLCKL